jgi:ribosomal protein L37AE/L43A
MVWPYVVTTQEEGTSKVEVRNPICPRCRGRATVTKEGDRIVLQCRRCNVIEHYGPYKSLAELKAHVRDLILEDLG